MNHVGILWISLAAIIFQNIVIIMSTPVRDVVKPKEPTTDSTFKVFPLEYDPNTVGEKWLAKAEEVKSMHNSIAPELEVTQTMVVDNVLETTEEEVEDSYNYVAAVLEYAPNTDAETGLETLITNALAYIVYAQQAKEAGADIIVFPEYGLTGTGLHIVPAEMLPYTQTVPDPAEAVSPCDLPGNDTSIQALRLLSCAARDLEVYLVVDVAERVANDGGPTEHTFYNTQFVLDREGTLIARYRKRNLFAEFPLHPGPVEADTAIFSTDFGVTFTLQVCFDILYEYPGVVNVREKGIKHVAMSTAWMDQLPSLTAPQMQSAWAESLGVNLLVANIHNPSGGFTGSGIYPGDADLEHLYTYNSEGSRLVIMNISSNERLVDNSSEGITRRIQTKENEKTTANGNIFNAAQTDESNQNSSNLITNKVKDTINKMLNVDDIEHKFKYEDLSIYSHLTLNQTIGGEILSETLCHTEEFCCNINYTWPETNANITYKLLAFEGLQNHAGGLYKTYYQVCSMLHCLSEDVMTCAHVDEHFVPQSNTLKVQSLEGLFDSPYVYPSILNQDLTLAKRNVWSFNNTDIDSNKWKAGIHIDKVDELDQVLALTLFGRLYGLDP